MSESERIIRELIAEKKGRLSKRALKRKSEIVSYGKLTYDLHKDEMSRPLHIAALYSNYGKISTLVIEVQGSPPKGMMIITFSSWTPLKPKYVYLEDNNFRLRRTNLEEMRISDPETYERWAFVISNFLKERGIPIYQETQFHGEVKGYDGG